MFVCTFITTAAFFGVINDDDSDFATDQKTLCMPRLAVLQKRPSVACIAAD